MIKLETVREHVLYELLIRELSYFNEISTGENKMDDDELQDLHKKIEDQCENFFLKEECVIAIQTFGESPDSGNIKIYHMDDLTGEINLLRICKIDEDLDMIRREYMTKRYVTRLFTRNYCDYTSDTLLAYDHGNDCYIEITGNKARTFPNTKHWLESEW